MRKILYFFIGLIIILLVLTALSNMVACCTPGECPKEDVYVRAELQNGTEAMIKIPKGTLDDPDSYYTQEEFDELIKQIQKQRGI